MFGQKLKELRKSKKLTQEQLADKIDVARTTYSSYEQGRREPDRETLIKIADYFEVSVDYLLDRESKPYYALTDKEKLDIGELSEKMLDGLYTDEEVDYFGEPMTDEDKARMKTILEMGLQLNKEKAKKKFTNKKYRNDK